ncbi:MAG TPA: ATP-binding protein [Polyangia bacterium]|jgi:C4-dicarboxylate-specific signal transduction histidine kinase
MLELKRAQERLEAALTAGDPEAVRTAARDLLERSRTTALTAAPPPEAPLGLGHASRLVDLGLQAASMVHELRQPLSGIKAFAQLIERSPDGSRAVTEKAAAIVRHAEAMEAICARLRSYARGEPPHRRPGDVNAAVASALEMLRFDLRKTSITVETVLAPDLPAVAADPIEIQQVLVNLVRNARDALGNRPGRVRIATAADDAAVTATVTDDGPGVPAEMRTRLFQPFATGGKEGGLGLGLFLSRQLAEAAGGALELLDGDRGAAFRLRLPRLAAEAGAGVDTSRGA